MADILIRGMSMPEDCGKCVVKYFTPCYEEKHLCPLTELPPHGDLIDRDALWEHVEDLACNIWVTASGVPVEALEKAPTVIEASSDSDG